jgi:hypothetical protein
MPVVVFGALMQVHQQMSKPWAGAAFPGLHFSLMKLRLCMGQVVVVFLLVVTVLMVQELDC